MKCSTLLSIIEFLNDVKISVLRWKNSSQLFFIFQRMTFIILISTCILKFIFAVLSYLPWNTGTIPHFDYTSNIISLISFLNTDQKKNIFISDFSIIYLPIVISLADNSLLKSYTPQRFEFHLSKFKMQIFYFYFWLFLYTILISACIEVSIILYLGYNTNELSSTLIAILSQTIVYYILTLTSGFGIKVSKRQEEIPSFSYIPLRDEYSVKRKHHLTPIIGYIFLLSSFSFALLHERLFGTMSLIAALIFIKPEPKWPHKASKFLRRITNKKARKTAVLIEQIFNIKKSNNVYK